MNEHGYFRTRDGVRLFYSVEGPKDAPPLLFCYGLVCSKLHWKYQMEKFRETHRVIYLDYRGHGKSGRPADASTVTIENLARDLEELMDELKISSMPVLGHSLGVNIILDLYRIAPKRVQALVLANGTPKDPFETMFNHNLLQVMFPVLTKAHSFFPELLGKFWKTQGTNPINQELIAIAGFNKKYAKREDINEYLRLTSTVDLDVFMNLIGDFIRHDATHWLHEVKVPTLVLAGEKDLITPPLNQRILAQLIPGAEFYEVSEGSHCPQMEKPEEVNGVIAEFLANIGKPRAIQVKPAVKKPKKKKTGKKPAAKKISPKNRKAAGSSPKLN